MAGRMDNQRRRSPRGDHDDFNSAPGRSVSGATQRKSILSSPQSSSSAPKRDPPPDGFAGQRSVRGGPEPVSIAEPLADRLQRREIGEYLGDPRSGCSALVSEQHGRPRTPITPPRRSKCRQDPIGPDCRRSSRNLGNLASGVARAGTEHGVRRSPDLVHTAKRPAGQDAWRQWLSALPARHQAFTRDQRRGRP
jgi:hypothetical protein